MSQSAEFVSVRAAREVVSLACRVAGSRKRGWDLAARMLRSSERVMKAVTYGEPARVDPLTAQAARNALARQRAAQIRAELAELEGTPDAGEILDHRQRVLGLAR